MDGVVIVVDVQNDFCAGGALEVPGANEIIPTINLLINNLGLRAVYTQDWHPPNHGSFASVAGVDPFHTGELGGVPQVFWPDHCVSGTKGAKFHPDLYRPEGAVSSLIFRKGMDPSIDSYSGFNGFLNDDTNVNKSLLTYLQEEKVGTVLICGLATDYCVKFTALDAVYFGFTTLVAPGACRGVAKNTTEEALAEMKAAGVKLL